jgi:hypothetical protein
MTTDTSRKRRRDSANDARDQAGAAANREMETLGVPDQAQQARRERLTKYPPLVRNARDQSPHYDSNDSPRLDENQTHDAPSRSANSLVVEYLGSDRAGHVGIKPGWWAIDSAGRAIKGPFQSHAEAVSAINRT